MTTKQHAVEKFDCPKCGAAAGYSCRDQRVFGGEPRAVTHPHKERVDEARKAGY